jgi:hypothetical protein
MYDLYYGVFLQPMRVHIGVKCITGKCLKGDYRQHKTFIILIYRACKACFMRIFVNQHETDLFNNMSKVDVRKLPEGNNIISFYKGLLHSVHEPSQVVALFMKMMNSIF